MNSKCQHISAMKHPVYFGTWKIPETPETAWLCNKCYIEWDKLWAKHFSPSVTKSIDNYEKILALWNKFFFKNRKEVVQFT